jgi:RimJ/RimL family protein N-acetyltransferase
MRPGQIVYQGQTERDIDIIIRYPKKEDIKSLLEFINSLSKEQTFIRLQGEQLTLDEEIKYLEDQIKKIENNQTIKLLAFHKDKLVGAADINLLDKIENHVGIFGITVAKNFRDKRIGKLLMKLVFQEAKKNIKQLKIVTLGVFANNPVAFNIYKKFGFVEYGMLPKGIKHKNIFVDHIYMYKAI